MPGLFIWGITVTINALPYIIILATFFGTTLIASRFSVGQFEPLTYVSLRLVVASLLHVAIYAASSKRAWPRDRQVWRHAPLLGILSTAIPMSLIVSSLQYQRSVVAQQVKWTGADYIGESCEETICKVQISIDYVVYGALPGVRSFEDSQVVEESWVYADGDWYFVPPQ